MRGDLATLLFDPHCRNHRTAAYVVAWRIVNALGLNRAVSRLLCRMGRYTQYSPGRCGWCGKPHVKISKHFQRLGVKRNALLDCRAQEASRIAREGVSDGWS